VPSARSRIFIFRRWRSPPSPPGTPPPGTPPSLFPFSRVLLLPLRHDKLGRCIGAAVVGAEKDVI